MTYTVLIAAFLACSIVSLALGAPSASAPASPGVHLLFQNDLDWTSTNNHPSYLLIDKAQSYNDASKACQRLSEQLIKPPASSSSASSDLRKQLRYLVSTDVLSSSGQAVWVDQGAIQVSKDGSWSTQKSKNKTQRLPVLCTNSAIRKTANESDTSSRWQIQVGGQDKKPTYTGYRDALSFRFWAVPYADTPKRFAQSKVFSGSGSIDATSTGRSRQCPQTAGTDSPWSEDCLVLSLYTPYLPGSSVKKAKLRPVLVWVHGGGFTSGSGLDFTFDGGPMASRGDIVVVNINYRLGTLGWLAYDDGKGTEIKGNFGLGDVVTALKWVRSNIATFGGDSSKVTVMGQSAGAQVVEALLGAPDAEGLFHRAAVHSGRAADQSSERQTIKNATAASTRDVVTKLGCGNSSDTLPCLRKLDAGKFLTTSSFAVPVVDNDLVTQPELTFAGAGGHVNRVPLLIGYASGEYASLGYVPLSSATNLDMELSNAKISQSDRQLVMNHSDAFSTTIPNGVQNVTVAVQTDVRTRCGVSATAFSAASKGVLPSVWAFYFNQRGFQIPNFDPNAACQPRDGMTGYYKCHSTDLLPSFGTPGYAFNLKPRDNQDVPWIRNQIDQWTSFVRTGDPNPSKSYTSARGYHSVGGSSWPKVGRHASSAKMISLGPTQKVVSLAQNAVQCEALGRGLQSIARAN